MRSTVPSQSNSLRYAGGSARRSFQPWLTMSGRIAARRSSRIESAAVDFGVQTHLWRLPVQYAALSSRMLNGTMPGACAASTSVSIPRASSSATISRIGRITAVGLDAWLMSASRVRGVTAERIASSASPGP